MDASAAACIANIGPRERRKRLQSGVVAFGVSVAIGAIGRMIASVTPERWIAVMEKSRRR